MDIAVLDTLPAAPLFDPAYKVNPYPYYREWTAKPPFWANVAGQCAVLAARYEDVAAIYLDHKRFSSVKPASADMARFDFFNGLQDLTHTDPPEHDRLRRTVNPAFMPGAVAKLTGRTQAAIDALLAPVIAKGGNFDIMTDLAQPLSLEVLLGILLDVAKSDYPLFSRMTHAMGMLGETTATQGKPQAYLDAWADCEAYCQRIIRIQLENPTDDLIGGVVRAAGLGIISESEMLVMVINLFIGGLSTIATLIGNAFVQLLTHPDQYKLLVADPMLAGNATDEVLRFDSPGLFNYKFARHDLIFAGLSIPRGTTIYLVHQATGFDPAVFPEPERFDIQRKMHRHLSFGYGIHFCIGAHLARLVTRLVLETAARHLPELQLSAEHPVAYGGWEQERAPQSVWVETGRFI